MAAPIPDYSKVSLLLPMSGANNGTVFTDYGPVAKSISRTGTITSTAQSKYYGASASFNGSSYSLNTPTSADFDFGTGDFFIGCWGYRTRNSAWQAMQSQWTNSYDSSPSLHINNSNEFAWLCKGGSTDYYTAGGASPLNAWAYYAAYRLSGTLYVTINGVVGGTRNMAGVQVGRNSNWYIGRASSSIDYFGGYLQDVLTIKGSAGIGTETGFAPPSRLIGEIQFETRDESGILVPRKIFAVPRSYPSVVKASGTTNASGVLTLSGLPACEYSVVAQADGDILPDLVLRRVAE